jgi:hypothetical protein
LQRLRAGIVSHGGGLDLGKKACPLLSVEHALCGSERAVQAAAHPTVALARIYLETRHFISRDCDFDARP